MLWSLLKILIFIGLIAALTFGLGVLANTDHILVIEAFGREYILTPVSASVMGLVLLLGVWALFRVIGLMVACIRFFTGDETAITRYFNRRSERKGYEALANGMMALAAGEARLAIRKAERAERYLKRPELTRMMIAQGAEMVGDKDLATKTYKALLRDDSTRFVGIQGLMKQKLADGDTDTALKLAEKGFALRPRNADIQTTLLGLQTQDEDWANARKTLAAALTSGHMPRDLHRRRDAVLALADARDAMAKGKITQATEGASQANRLAPGLVPAAAMTARLATAEGNPTQAAKIIKTAWGHCPHPDLAAAFADIAPDETPAKRLARFKPLLSVQPQHAQTRLLEAELQIAAEDFHAARRALGDLATTQPTTRSLTIMAAIEKGLGGDDHIVRAWLAKGVTASRGPQWICGKCGHISADWHPVCQNCDGFDTLSWEESQQSDASLASAVDMLPHIIGLLEEDPPIRPAIIAQDDTAFGDIKSQD